MTSKPKILLLGKTPPPYMGPSIATKILLESSLEDTFVIIHQETKLNNNLDNIGKLSFSKPFILLQRYIVFTIKCFIHQPDLVLVPISQSWAGFSKDAIFIKIGAFFKRKILVHLRGSNFHTFYNQLPESKQKSIHHTLKKCTGAIVLGQKLRYIFKPFFSSEKIHVVPNGGNYTFSTTQQLNNSKNHRLNLIYLGNLQPSKGILDVIEAFVQLPMLMSDSLLHIHIVGQWRDETTSLAVFNLLNESGFEMDESTAGHFFNSSTSQQITFHAVLHGQAKLDLLASCDIMIFPPREPEGHPWVIIEAMAAGLPIISTDQGAITESVVDGVNGFIVAKENPQAIAEKVQYLLINPYIRERMGKESRRLYEEKFTEEAMVKNLTCAIIAVIND